MATGILKLAFECFKLVEALCLSVEQLRTRSWRSSVNQNSDAHGPVDVAGQLIKGLTIWKTYGAIADLDLGITRTAFFECVRETPFDRREIRFHCCMAILWGIGIGLQRGLLKL